MTDRMPDVGDVAAIPLRDGYGACLVTGLGPMACALDFFSAGMPSLDELADAQPLILDHHVLRGQPTEINVIGDEPPPPWWVWLGRRDLPAGVAERVDSHAGWSWLSGQIAAQRRWDVALPPFAKEAYRTGQGKATSLLDMTGAAASWADLDRLPRCRSLVWSGPDRGLREALVAHPIVSDLTWVDAPRRVDLTGTYLTRLRLSASDVDVVRLPDDLETLKLDEDTRVASVVAADDGRWLRLTADRAEVPRGLTGLWDLELTGDGTISAGALEGLRDLRRLRLAWRAAPGELSGAVALSGLSRLTDVKFVGAYGLTARTLPDLPSLSWLVCDGLYRKAAAGIEARYRDADVRVDITGVENEWREF
ncbi:hypothetical protein ACFQS1_23625 [Paractinoplanes rhizophilus]|uniref:Uncharacterized protein n=1 Tax=Paractinoplanes rhizophilus TaxID=1416877 RepID=A0ABW2HV40_9ACTN|nr:hypothetical protein [Actinoplanes sp.]